MFPAQRERESARDHFVVVHEEHAWHERRRLLT
jgi:hypothetical protein